MHIVLGHQPPTDKLITWDPSRLINPHMAVAGDSGSGKTANLRFWCEQLARQAREGRVGGLRRVHIFDSHGDIEVPASTVMFSQGTPYGYNPLEVDPDIHFGGVREAVNSFMRLLQVGGHRLGPLQEPVLRNLLLDVYQRHGFHPDDPASWHIDPAEMRRPAGLPAERIYLDLPVEENDAAKAAARAEGASLVFDTDLRSWWTNRHVGALRRWPERTWGRRFPNIHDVISLARLKRKQLFVGTDHAGMLALEALNRANAALFRKIKDTRKRAGEAELERLQVERDRAAAKALEATKAFIERISTGTEIDDLLRYDSPDTLKGIIDRMDNLAARGLCRAVPPPLDDRQLVWRYDIHAYHDDEKRMFVDNRLERILREAVMRGRVDEVTDIVVIDEAPKFMVDDGDHVISRVVSEARKYGVALILLAQSPTQFPERVLAGVGTKLILALDVRYHKVAANHLALDATYIAKLQPWRLGLVNFKPRGDYQAWFPLGMSDFGAGEAAAARMLESA